MKFLVSLSSMSYMPECEAVIPLNEKVMAELLEEEVQLHGNGNFMNAPIAVQKDEFNSNEMATGIVTVGDGIETETW